jgi:hypothetical protein
VIWWHNLFGYGPNCSVIELQHENINTPRAKGGSYGNIELAEAGMTTACDHAQ